MRTRRAVRPAAPLAVVVTAALALAVLAGVLLLDRADHDPAVDEPLLGAVLSESDHRELDAPGVLRGATPAPVDPAVEQFDARAVARAYLVAAHGALAGDAGRTHLRAVGYAVPGTPPATVGVLVLDPPPPGSVRVAAVVDLDLIAADLADRRRGYLATVATTTVGSGAGLSDVLTRNIVLARQPDGRWLVAAENPATPDLPAGEG